MTLQTTIDKSTQAEIDLFNQKHPLRSFIKFKDEKGNIVEAEVRAEAEFSRSSEIPSIRCNDDEEEKIENIPIKKGVPVVYVKGRYDGVHLKDVLK
jgi:hypothetical protein